MDKKLSEWWDELWTAISGPADPLLKLAGLLGAAFVAGVVLMWVFRKIRGGQSGARQGAPLWTIALAAVLAAPSVLVPLLLKIVDAGVEAGVDVFKQVTG